MTVRHFHTSIPGKTFALGEYAVLAGGRALIITHQPHFTLTAQPCALAKSSPIFHPHSPAGQLWQAYSTIMDGYQLSFDAPYPKGGLGRSSAEFIGLHRFIHWRECGNSGDWLTIFNAYRQQTANSLSPPSGADVAAQCCSGVTLFTPIEVNHPTSKAQTSILTWPFADLGFIVFHTGHKLPTHDHLSTLGYTFQDLSVFCPLADAGIAALLAADGAAFIQSIHAYHQQLQAMSLVAAHTLAQLANLQQIPNVLAVKGCGAYGADTGLIIHRIGAQQPILDHLKRQGLSVIADQNTIAAA